MEELIFNVWDFFFFNDFFFTFNSWLANRHVVNLSKIDLCSIKLIILTFDDLCFSTRKISVVFLSLNLISTQTSKLISQRYLADDIANI